MSQALDFRGTAESPAESPKVRLRVVPRSAEIDKIDEFWPAVSHRNLPDDEIVDPANTPKQVLSEVFALFAVVAAFVVAVTLFVPGP